MAKRVLVPLDQSTAAEAVVPVIGDMARGGGATVRLLHVAPIPDAVHGVDGRIVSYADQETARLEAEAMDYLRTIEAQLDGVPVECAVRFGEPLPEILADAEAFGADLVVLATAGGNPMGRIIRGSLAEHLLHETPVAALILRPARWATT